MDKIIDQLGFKTFEDMIASVGYGKTTPLQIVRKFVSKPVTEDDESILDKLIGRVRKKKTTSGVVVKGIDDILIKFGKCCQPVPGDPITGYITQGYGVTVHRTICVNALKMNPERQIDVEWSVNSSDLYQVKIHITSNDRVGLLADIASNISKNGANIIGANTVTRENKTVDSLFTLTVKDTDHLKKVLTDLKKVKLVVDAKRIDE
jgi:GTP pyrophosphokinase